MFEQEAKSLYDAREAVKETQAELNTINQEIEDLIKAHKPDLLAQRERWQEALKAHKVLEATAYDTFVAMVTDHAESYYDPYGKGKLHPHVTIENKSFVEFEPAHADIVAAWLLARGMADRIKFDFKPIDAFRHISEEHFPRNPTGVRKVMWIRQGPNVKVDAHDRWEKPEPNVADPA